MYDETNEPGTGDAFTLAIEELWSIITDPNLNAGNPEIISTFHDLRMVLINAGKNVNGDIDELFIQRLAFLDTNSNCVHDLSELIGPTQWAPRDSEAATLVTHDVARLSGTFNPRQNMSLEVRDRETGEHATDFDVVVFVKFEPPNDIYNFHSAVRVDISPYVFKSLLFEPSTIEIMVLKDRVEPASVEMTSDEFWTAYTSDAVVVSDALITKTVTIEGGGGGMSDVTWGMTGVNVDRVVCKNKTTGQKARSDKTVPALGSCGDLGLTWNAGDTIQIKAVGTVVSIANIGGSLTGITPTLLVCKNRSRIDPQTEKHEKVRVENPGVPWKCTDEGLPVAVGERLQWKVRGLAN